MSKLGFVRVKGIALPVTDLERANRFYGETLGLKPTSGEDLPPGFELGEAILMLKEDWYAPPSAEPSPRVTFEVTDARATEAALRAMGVTISDPVEVFGTHPVGAFLDSEGNKLWFCSLDA